MQSTSKPCAHCVEHSFALIPNFLTKATDIQVFIDDNVQQGFTLCDLCSGFHAILINNVQYNLFSCAAKAHDHPNIKDTKLNFKYMQVCQFMHTNKLFKLFFNYTVIDVNVKHIH